MCHWLYTFSWCDTGNHFFGPSLGYQSQICARATAINLRFGSCGEITDKKIKPETTVWVCYRCLIRGVWVRRLLGLRRAEPDQEVSAEELREAARERRDRRERERARREWMRRDFVGPY